MARPEIGIVVHAWSPGTNELLLETEGNYIVMGIDRYLAQDEESEVSIADAHHAEFTLNNVTMTIPLASNVGDMVPLQ